jgi:hypothetical protein
MIKTMSGLAIAAMAGAAAAAYAPVASAGEPAPAPYPYHIGEFVDNYGYYYDTCAFDYKPGKNVKFETKQVVEYVYGYPVYYTILKATCRFDYPYKSYKKITFKNFKCIYTDKNDPYAETVIETYDSKWQIRKGSRYAHLVCKFKTENDPMTPPTDSAE